MKKHQGTKYMYALWALVLYAVPLYNSGSYDDNTRVCAQLMAAHAGTEDSSNSEKDTTEAFRLPNGTIQLITAVAVDSDWGSGYQVTVTVKNPSSESTTSWTASFNLVNSQEKVTSLWNANYTQTGTLIKVTNPSWMGGEVIRPGESITFGFVVGNAVPGTRTFANLQATGTTQTPVPQPLQAPVLNAIEQSSTNPANYTVSWSAVASATSYTLQQSTTSAFTNPVVVAQASTTSKAFTNQPSGTYYYRVLASNDSGTSSFSNVQSVTVNVTPVLPAPVLNAIEQSSTNPGNYTVSWSTVAGATSYTLQQATTSAFTNPVVVSQTSTSKAFTNQPNGTYYYRVLASNTSGTSAFSNVQSVAVNVPTPSTGAIVEGYWESWTTRDSISSIIAMKTDVIDVSFATFSRTGTNTFSVVGLDTSLSNFTQFISAAHAAGKKVKIAVGGASYGLSPFLQSTQDAQGMAAAIAQFVRQYSLDGVDWDIEDHPAASLQIALIQYTRQQLGNNYIVSYTPATPASTTAPFAQVIAGAHQYLDYISMMAYDAYASYNYKDDVQALIKMGVPASKIVVGFMPGNDDIGIHTSLNMIKDASQYVLTNGLRGIMFWSLNRDLANITGLGASAATNAAWSIIHP